MPDNTPADADLYLTGPFNQWNPKDRQYQFSQNEDGTYMLVLSLDEGSLLEFRLTRGTFANAKKLDPDDRFANHSLTVPGGVAAEAVEITVEGWWDD